MKTLQSEDIANAVLYAIRNTSTKSCECQREIDKAHSPGKVITNSPIITSIDGSIEINSES
ncbi:MAG: hypothetical protein WCF03_13555 [Nitrososphaeraceae archaeon]